MTNNKKLLIGVGVVAALGLFLYYKFGKKTQDNKRGQTYEEVVRSGGGGINPPHLQKLRDCDQKYKEAYPPSMQKVYISPEKEAKQKESFMSKCMG